MNMLRTPPGTAGTPESFQSYCRHVYETGSVRRRRETVNEKAGRTVLLKGPQFCCGFAAEVFAVRKSAGGRLPVLFGGDAVDISYGKVRAAPSSFRSGAFF